MKVVDLTDLPISDDEEIEVSREELENALDGLTEVRLRRIVIMLADRILAFRSALLKEAVVVIGQKRKAAPRWDVCDNCEEEYDVSEECDEEECRYHTGYLSADYDERCHSPTGTEEISWNCCGEDALSKGCMVGYHAAGGPKLKKRR